uniref:RING finger protein 8 n=1 Tax=Mycena chlorophos TaxID=658473 RepID=A0ABQ0LF28_MYCCL|nr:RING finger protein 8 [Mycena chlorophos]
MADEFDELPDEWAGRDIDWDTLLGAPQSPQLPDYEPLDASVLAQLDILDGTVLPPSSVTTNPCTASTPSSSLKRRRSGSEATDNIRQTPSKKKRKSSLARALGGFEEELNCPICCDLLVAAQLLNPCGHSMCGDCARQWTAVKMKTTCPLCRTALSPKPMAPNIVLDKLVDVYIETLAVEDTGWQTGGNELVEFTKRRIKWRDAERERLSVVPKVIWVIDDSDEEDEDSEPEEDLDSKLMIGIDTFRHRMHVSFHPPLGRVLRVPATSTAFFTATVHKAADYRALVAGHVKIQLWSDLLSPTWDEADFTLVPPPNPDSLSLILPQPNVAGQLLLAVKIPTNQAREFSFTYRILHTQSGNIDWRGGYGQNGSIIVEETESRPVVLDETWSPAMEAKSLVRAAVGRAVQEAEVAKVNPNYHTFYQSAEVLILVHVGVCTQTRFLVFSATAGTLSVDSHGIVRAAGDPTISFSACQSVDELQEMAASLRLNFITTADATLLASTSEIAVLPNSAAPISHEMTLPLRDIATVSRTSLPFSITARDHQLARFFSEEDSESLSPVVGPSGAQLVLVPMSRVRRDGGHWHIGVVPLHTSTAVDTLPTPPPSPQLRPVAHRTSSNSPDPSLLQLGAQTQVVVPEMSAPSSVVKPHPNMFLLIGYAIFAILAWIVRLLLCRRRKSVRRIQAAPPDERTPLLDEPEVVPAIQVQDTSVIFAANIDGGKTILLLHGPNTPDDFHIQLNGQDVDAFVQKMDDLLYKAEFSSPAGGKLSVA